MFTGASAWVTYQHVQIGNLFHCIDVVAFELKFNLSYASLNSIVIKYINKDYSKELIII